MSDRKQRQLDRLSPEDRILLDVRGISEAYPVVSVESHMVGYFNELGITVDLRPDANKAEFLALRSALRDYFDKTYALSPPKFTWMVMFTRTRERLHPLIQGDLAWVEIPWPE
jgi:hypothetical protein